MNKANDKGFSATEGKIILMTDKQISQLVASELAKPKLGLVEQFLEIHAVAISNNEPIVERIDRDSPNGVIIAYLPVVGERFHLAITIDSNSQSIMGCHSEPFSRIYFRVSSDAISEDQLRALTALKPTEAWSNGAKRSDGRGTHSFSYLRFEPNPEPDEFEDKLDKLLNFLEQDISGVKSLVGKANGYIQVAMILHNANGMLGGPSLSRQIIRRRNDLDSEIDFDLYAEGNSLR